MTLIPFIKMQGCANDYIYLDCLTTDVPNDISTLAIEMSARHFSVGADGIVCICKPTTPAADAKMRMFNADGSEGKMCGNAIRCVGKYLADQGLVKNTAIIETLSGTKTLELIYENNTCIAAKVNMGRADIQCKNIPVTHPADTMINSPLTVDNKTYNITAVSMGNPHAVVFIPTSPNSLPLEKIGPKFETHPSFPERVNTEFAHIITPTEIEMRVWERGSGETYACGTGACATAAAAYLNNLTPANTPITVHLKGGDLTITVTPELEVTMQGPAKTVYTGIYCREERREKREEKR